MVPGGQGVGLQGPRGSRVRPTGSQGVKGEVSGVPKDQQRQHGCVGPPEVVQEVLADSKNNFWAFLDLTLLAKQLYNSKRVLIFCLVMSL